MAVRNRSYEVSGTVPWPWRDDEILGLYFAKPSYC
jgi:hypothetical protein